MNKVIFSDVVRRANTKEDKDNTEKEYYVGGEHIDSNEVLITKRGIISGSTIGPMFYFGFNAGQVLLVSRNPHLRKAGMVTFDGICSEKSFVLETIDESILLQRYLPLVLQSDHFWSFAEANKSGSVNFFINWSTLAKYEFDLPSITKQKELSDLLWSINNAKLAYRNMIQKTDELVKSQFIEMFGDPVKNPMGWETKPFSDVAPESRYDGNFDEIVWLLNLDMVESNSGRLIEKLRVPIESVGNSTCTFSCDHVLYSKLRPYLNKVVVPDEKGYATTEMIPMKPNPNILNRYFLAHLLRSDEFVTYVTNLSAGTRMPRVPMSDFRNFKCILPPIEIQNKFVTVVEKVDKSKLEIAQMIETTEALYRSLLAENFS